MKAPVHPISGLDTVREGIYNLQNAFRTVLLEPAVIELASWDEGQRLIRMLAQDPMIGQAILMEHKDGRALWQVSLEGTLVRWPTLRQAQPKGGWKYV